MQERPWPYGVHDGEMLLLLLLLLLRAASQQSHTAAAAPPGRLSQLASWSRLGATPCSSSRAFSSLQTTRVTGHF